MLNAMTINTTGATTEEIEESARGIGFADEVIAADPRWDCEPEYSPEEIEAMYQAHLDYTWAEIDRREAQYLAEFDAEMRLFAQFMEALPGALAGVLG